MHFIVVKFETKPEWTERWLDLVADFTRDTRQEPGNLWYEWNRSVEEPGVFTLVEAFTAEGAAEHVNSAHFAKAMVDMRKALVSTPKIISRQIEGNGWEDMGELRID